jgi:hypothetical protein
VVAPYGSVVRRILLGLAAAGVIAAGCPAAAATQPAWSATVTTKLAGGARILRYRDVTVPGQTGTYHLVTVTWPLGDHHFRIRTALPGGAPLEGGWLTRRGLASWGSTSAPSGLVAAISPDYGSYTPKLAHTSGLLIRNGVILQLPTGVVASPSLGYTTDDRMVFGTPRAVPVQLQLAGGGTTIAAVESLPSDPATVGLYRRPGDTVVVPDGYTAVTLASDPAAASPILHPTVRTPGESVVYALHDAAAPRLTQSIQFRRVGTARATVPAGGAVLVMRLGGAGDLGFAAIGDSGDVKVTQTDTAWQSVRWVMGGKPLLVSGGVPVAEKPMTMTAYQWTAMTARAAVGRTANGRGVLAIVSAQNRDQAGTKVTGFAALLGRIGVTDAIGLDAGPVPELYSPRLRSTTCRPIAATFCYRATPSEFRVPAATIVTYTP